MYQLKVFFETCMKTNAAINQQADAMKIGTLDSPVMCMRGAFSENKVISARGAIPVIRVVILPVCLLFWREKGRKLNLKVI